MSATQETGGTFMKNLIVIVMTLLISNAALAIDCTGQIDTYESSGVTTVKEKLEGDNEKLQLDLENAYFSFSDYQDGAFTAIISIGPEYTTGNLAKGIFDKNGKFKLTYITPNKSYILNCQTQL